MFHQLKPLGSHFNQWLKLLTKATCPLCQRPTSQAFCLDCQRQLQRCQRSTDWVQDQNLSTLAWGSYNGSLKRAIAALKYHHHPELAVPLGMWMANTWMQSQTGEIAPTVVPIPMHDRKQQERGFNQAHLLAKSFCAMTGLRLEPNGLKRNRDTEAQFRLSNAARNQNLRDAFCLGSAFIKRSSTRPILLLDDIYTTGATARSAAQTLRSQGIRVHGIIVLAIADQPNQRV